MKRFLIFLFALFAISAAYADDMECKLGQYFDGEKCVYCPTGTTTDTTTATECTPCPAGTYGTTSGFGGNKRAICTLCPAGTYNGTTGATECTKCTYNTFSDVVGAIDASVCTSCPDGTYSNEGASVCISGITCPAGTYRTSSGIGVNKKTFCAQCVAGTYSKAINATNADVCIPCPAGTFSLGGASECTTTCPDGATLSIGADECERVLNYLPPNDINPTKIRIGTRKKTSPALAIQIGKDIYYANMIATKTKSIPGLYIAYNDNNYLIPSKTNSVFYITTTPDTTQFNFKLGARGNFTVDWGDGNIEIITQQVTVNTEYTHTYDTPGEYTIGISGVASEYRTASCVGASCPSAITFANNTNVFKISGNLGVLFPKIGDTQPRFQKIFYKCTNLTGEIPVGLFGDLSDTPSSYMFYQAFYGCEKLTGPTACNPDGSRIYDIEYNGEKWIDAYPTAFTDMYTGSGIDTSK